jgi:hypothetical protein
LAAIDSLNPSLESDMTFTVRLQQRYSLKFIAALQIGAGNVYAAVAQRNLSASCAILIFIFSRDPTYISPCFSGKIDSNRMLAITKMQKIEIA